MIICISTINIFLGINWQYQKYIELKMNFFFELIGLHNQEPKILAQIKNG